MNCLDPLQNHHSSAVHIPGPYFLNKVIKIPVRRYKYVLGQEVYMLLIYVWFWLTIMWQLDLLFVVIFRWKPGWRSGYIFFTLFKKNLDVLCSLC